MKGSLIATLKGESAKAAITALENESGIIWQVSDDGNSVELWEDAD